MNPRIQKIGRNILFLLSIPGLVSAFVYAQSNNEQPTCSAIDIRIENPAFSFVTHQDIASILEDRGIEVGETHVKEIQISRLEKRIVENPWVKSVNMYISAGRCLHVQVMQKQPVLRLQPEDTTMHACYLDADANPVPLSSQYIAQVPILTAPRLGYSQIDLQWKREAVELAEYIQSDSFWNAMVTQINLNPKQGFELIPALGEQLILVGHAENLDDKMKRLLAFYLSGLQTIDWQKYDQIDVRFDKQVVARNTKVKSLPPREALLKELENEMSNHQQDKQQVAVNGVTHINHKQQTTKH
jgi:cell division protein FtsQ